MARVGFFCACALLILVNSIGVNAAPSRERRSPTFGLAKSAADAVLGVPAAILAAPAVVLGEARYTSGFGGGYGNDNGGPVGINGPGYAGSDNNDGLPGISFSSSKSFSIGGGNAQSSASSSAGGYGNGY